MAHLTSTKLSNQQNVCFDESIASLKNQHLVQSFTNSHGQREITLHQNESQQTLADHCKEFIINAKSPISPTGSNPTSPLGGMITLQVDD